MITAVLLELCIQVLGAVALGLILICEALAGGGGCDGGW